MTNVSPRTLSLQSTFIREFMCDQSQNLKLFNDLVGIFERCYPFFKGHDPSNDLRVLEYEELMKAGKWDSDIQILLDQNGDAWDGIHRGIAYLRCVNDGVEESKLPKVYI